MEITPRRKDIIETAEVRFDGSHKMMLRPGERLTVRKAKQKTRMIQFSNISFLERIRIRMREN